MTARRGALLLGRVTYEEFAPVWPSTTEDFACYHLLVFPLLLGGGRRLFGDGPRQRLRLVESETYSNGVTKAVYDMQR